MDELKKRRLLETLYKIHHQVMMVVTENKDLDTVGEEFKEKVEVAETSSNVLAVKIQAKG